MSVGGESFDRIRTIARALLLVLLCLPASQAGSADVVEGRLRYWLCRGNVASSEIVVASGSYALAVQMNRESARELAGLSRTDPAKMLEIAFADRLLLRLPAVRAPRSGTFIVPFGDLDAADLALTELRDSLREGPCGLVADENQD